MEVVRYLVVIIGAVSAGALFWSLATLLGNKHQSWSKRHMRIDQTDGAGNVVRWVVETDWLGMRFLKTRRRFQSTLQALLFSQFRSD
jgi:hypothetical protein